MGRLEGLGVEAMSEAEPGPIRVAQLGVETMSNPGDGPIQLAQLGVEVMSNPSPAPISLAQLGVEVMSGATPPAPPPAWPLGQVGNIRDAVEVFTASPLIPGLDLINNQAAGFFKFDADLQEFPNLVPGAGDTAVSGSTTSPDANDPLPFVSDLPALWTPSVIGAFTSATTSPAPEGGDYAEWAVRARLPQLGTLSVSLGAANSTNFTLLVTSDRRISGRVYSTVAAFIGNAAPSGQVPLAAADLWAWYRVRVHRTTGIVESWYSLDQADLADFGSISWVALGSAAGANPGGEFSSTARTTRFVGCHTQGFANGMFNGETQARWDFDGTIDTFDAADNVNRSQVSFLSGGLTWTIARPQVGNKTAWVARNRGFHQLDGAGQYIEFPPSCTPTTGEGSGDFFALAAVRRFGDSSGSNRRFLSSEAAAGSNGLTVYTSDGDNYLAFYNGGTAGTNTAAGTMADGEIDVIGVKHSAGSLYAYRFGDGLTAAASTAGDGDAAHAALRLGSVGGAVANLACAGAFNAVVGHTDPSEADLNLMAAYMRSIAS